MDFYCAYVGWASEVIRETAQPLMSLFAEWLIEESATDGNAVHVALSMARELYASAFEFIAIGNRLPELGALSSLSSRNNLLRVWIDPCSG